MKTTSKKQFATLFMLFVICIAITAHAASPDKGPAPVKVKNKPDVNVVNEPNEPVPVISVGPTR